MARAAAAAGGPDFGAMAANCAEYMTGLASATATVQAGAKGGASGDAVRSANAEASRLLRGACSWRCSYRGRAFHGSSTETGRAAEGLACCIRPDPTAAALSSSAPPPAVQSWTARLPT